jgi:hypothetical protein
MSNSRRLPRPSLALVVALLALVVATGGTSYAAVTLAKNSVLSKHIKNGQVKTADLKDGAVTGAKVKDGSLAAGDFAAGQLPAGPAGPAGAKGDTGAQGVPGPVNLVTVVETSSVITPGDFDTVVVECPAGMKAVSGGIDNENVLTMVVTASAPWAENKRTLSLTDGQHAGPTGWYVAARNNAGVNYIFKAAVVCAS